MARRPNTKKKKKITSLKRSNRKKAFIGIAEVRFVQMRFPYSAQTYVSLFILYQRSNLGELNIFFFKVLHQTDQSQGNFYYFGLQNDLPNAESNAILIFGK